MDGRPFPDAQQREGEYSPSKAQTLRSFPAEPFTAQQREGEYSPSKARCGAPRCTPASPAQQREGEYSPSKRRRLPPSSSRAARWPAQQREGEYSPSKRRGRLGRLRRGHCALNKGRGNTPPPSADSSPPQDRSAADAQQREGEYSPSKDIERADSAGDHFDRSTKGGGILPLQGVPGAPVMPPTATTAQQREGEYSPSKPAQGCVRPACSTPAQQREGEYSPSKDGLEQGHVLLDVGRSTKGGGILPLQAPTPASLRQASPLPAQQREGEYSPSKAALLALPRPAGARSTKGGGILPLQAVLLVSVVVAMPAFAQQREGEYSPSKATQSASPSLSSNAAQQREGEYSPSKPPYRQRGLIARRAQQREGEYSPSKCAQPRSPDALPSAQQREGEYSPSKTCFATLLAMLVVAAQQREGEYSPSKPSCHGR